MEIPEKIGEGIKEKVILTVTSQSYPSNKNSIVLITEVDNYATTPVLPEKEIHPSLFFYSNEVESLRKRVEKEPYNNWYSYFKRLVDKSYLYEDYTKKWLPDERGKAAYGLAFIYVIEGDERYLEKAKEALFNIDKEAEYSSEDIALYFTIEGLKWSAIAYDWLYNDLSQVENEKIRGFLEKRADELISILEYKYNGRIFTNYGIKIESSVGLVALAMSENPKAYDWLDKSLNYSKFTWEDNLSKDGGYAEGAHYFRVCMEDFIPFAKAYKRLSGVNLFQDDMIKSSFEFMIKIQTPLGEAPQYDDSLHDPKYNTLSWVMNEYQDIEEEMHWTWKKFEDYFMKKKGYSSGNWGDYTINQILFYDDSIGVREPSFEPTVFMPNSGITVLRDSWDLNSNYLIFLSETEYGMDTRINHEHGDTLSFILYAYGAWLMPDPGYGLHKGITYSQIDEWYRLPEAHNLIMVDDFGPKSGKKYVGKITRFFDTSFIDFVTGETIYPEKPDTLLRRNIFSVDSKYYIIFDEIFSNSIHKYSWFFHGIGDFILKENLAEWKTTSLTTGKKVKLQAYFSNPELIINEGKGKGYYQVSWDKYNFKAPYIQAETQAQNVKNLIILYPINYDQEDPSFLDLENERIGGVQINNDLMFINKEKLTIKFNGIETDSLFTILSNQDYPEYFMLVEGRKLKIKDKTIFDSDKKTVVALKYSEYRIEGYILGKTEQTLSIFSLQKPIRILFKDEEIPFDFENQIVQLEIKGKGKIEIVLKEKPKEESEKEPTQETQPLEKEAEEKSNNLILIMVIIIIFILGILILKKYGRD
ncbi:MAG: heparinase II/III family protein [Candidatus Methanofastidiosia archaeon]